MWRFNARTTTLIAYIERNIMLSHFSVTIKLLTHFCTMRMGDTNYWLWKLTVNCDHARYERSFMLHVIKSHNIWKTWSIIEYLAQTIPMFLELSLLHCGMCPAALLLSIFHPLVPKPFPLDLCHSKWRFLPLRSWWCSPLTFWSCVLLVRALGELHLIISPSGWILVLSLLRPH